MDLQRVSEDYKLSKKSFLSKHFEKARATLAKYFEDGPDNLFAMYEQKSVNLILVNNVLNLYASVTNELIKTGEINNSHVDALLEQYIQALGHDYAEASPEIFYSCFLVEYLNGSGPTRYTRLAERIELEYLAHLTPEVYNEAFSKLYQSHLQRLLDLYLVHVLPRAAKEPEATRNDAFAREFIANSPYIQAEAKEGYLARLAAKHTEMADEEKQRAEAAVRAAEVEQKRADEKRAEETASKLKDGQVRALKAKLMADNHQEAVLAVARQTALSEAASGAQTPTPEKKPQRQPQSMLQRLFRANHRQLIEVGKLLKARVPHLVVLLLLVVLGRGLVRKKKGSVWEKVVETVKMAVKVTYV